MIIPAIVVDGRGYFLLSTHLGQNLLKDIIQNTRQALTLTDDHAKGIHVGGVTTALFRSCLGTSFSVISLRRKKIVLIIVADCRTNKMKICFTLLIKLGK